MSGKASRAKGSRWETEVANYLRDNGFPHAEKRGPGQPIDRGDITGLPAVIECKNHARLALAEWIDQAQAAKHHTPHPVAAVVIKRKGTTNVGHAYALLTLEDLTRLLAERSNPQ